MQPISRGFFASQFASRGQRMWILPCFPAVGMGFSRVSSCSTMHRGSRPLQQTLNRVSTGFHTAELHLSRLSVITEYASDFLQWEMLELTQDHVGGTSATRFPAISGPTVAKFETKLVALSYLCVFRLVSTKYELSYVFWIKLKVKRCSRWQFYSIHAEVPAIWNSTVANAILFRLFY